MGRVIDSSQRAATVNMTSPSEGVSVASRRKSVKLAEDIKPEPRRSHSTNTTSTSETPSSPLKSTMSGIKKTLSKIVKHGHSSSSASLPTSPTGVNGTPTSRSPIHSGAATPNGNESHASSVDRIPLHGIPDTAAQRQAKRNASRSKSRARSRDPKSPNGSRPQSQVRPGRSRSRARRLSFTEEKYIRDKEREEENEREAKERKERQKRLHDEDPLREHYGDLPMNMSRERKDLQLIKLPEIATKDVGETVRFRARVHHIRPVGPKIAFIVFRHQLYTIQGVLTEENDEVSENMVRWAEGLGRETVVLVQGVVQPPPESQGEVKSTTIHERELKVTRLHVIAHPTVSLPFQVEDVSKPAEFYKQDNSHKVGERTRLENRVLDLRAPASQSIFKIHAAICKLFRNYLDDHGFTEIQSSKFQEATAESGAAVFKVDYFRKPVYLAQSPQLAKQMCIAADMERVYEIGPVFRAENSNTHRHLTEFIGLDLEMAFESHYEEVMDLIDGMFLHIFRGLQSKYKDEIESVKKSYPHDDLVFLDKTLRLNFADGVKLLVESGYKDEDGSVPNELEDLSTAAERRLGQLVKEKYNTDYYILNKFPAAVRPFYTMRDPNNDKLSNSYDFFIRGEEILSGGQRIHDAPLLEERMREAGIDPASMKDYLDGFRYGCPPHGGGGIGLERVVMLFLKLGNIRWASLIPRDPRSFSLGDVDPKEASAAAAAATILHGPESTTFQGKLGRMKNGELPPLENLIAHYGDATNTSWVDPAWTVWRDQNTGAAVGYVPVNGYAVTFGNPLCERNQIPQVCREYLRFLEHEKLKPVWACIDHDTEQFLAEELGWSALIAVAEERINPADVDPANDKNVRRKINRAEREGVKIHEVGDLDDELKANIEQRCKDWSEARKGTQIHLTGVRPFDDVQHRKYYYATDKDGKICALVVLAQLAASKGFQIKWALEFPGAPLGAIEHILAYVIRKMGDAGVRNATFGAGATAEMQRVENIGGFRVRTLEKAYNGISHTFNLGNKGDFRSKFGTHQEPMFVCYPKNSLGIKGVQAIMSMLQMEK